MDWIGSYDSSVVSVTSLKDPSKVWKLNAAKVSFTHLPDGSTLLCIVPLIILKDSDEVNSKEEVKKKSSSKSSPKRKNVSVKDEINSKQLNKRRHEKNKLPVAGENKSPTTISRLPILVRKGVAERRYIYPRCNVDGCNNYRQGKVLRHDKHGVAGSRCMKHDAIYPRCNVNGCRKFRQGRVLRKDKHGVPGLRCKMHGAIMRRCDVSGCGNRSRGVIMNKDKFGEAGRRCNWHRARGHRQDGCAIGKAGRKCN